MRRIRHHRGLRDAKGSILDRRFDEQRKFQLAWHAQTRVAPAYREARCRNAMEREELLTQELVAREHEATRVAAGIGLAQQLEKGDDVLIVSDYPAELLEQIEDDVGLPVGDRGAQFGQEFGGIVTYD